MAVDIQAGVVLWVQRANLKLGCPGWPEKRSPVGSVQQRVATRAGRLLYNSIYSMNNIAQNTVYLSKSAYFYVILRIVHTLFGI